MLHHGLCSLLYIWWRVVLFVSLQRRMLFKSAHPSIDSKIHSRFSDTLLMRFSECPQTSIRPSNYRGCSISGLAAESRPGSFTDREKGRERTGTWILRDILGPNYGSSTSLGPFTISNVISEFYSCVVSCAVAPPCSPVSLRGNVSMILPVSPT